MAESPYADPDPVPIYILIILAIFLCAYFVWLTSVAVRLYFYKGALGPEPTKFVILPTYLRDRSPQRRDHKRITAFPIPLSPQSPAGKIAQLSRFSRVNIADVHANDLPDPEIRAFFAEQQRISRLPAFVQDDCGDGSDFPDVPVAITPVEVKQMTLTPEEITRQPSTTRKALSLEKIDQSERLLIDTTYKAMHTARDFLLTKKHIECIQIKRDGETACEELLAEIVKLLVSKYPVDFSIKTINRRRHIRNEITKEEWSLVRPFDCHPLEVCARLAMEDFHILLKGEFTQQYYLQASAALSPAGWRMRGLIGKPLLNLHDQDIHQWDNIPDILPLATSTTPLARSNLYIQTHPDNRPLATLLFIQEPKDFFPGNLSSLLPKHIVVRREHQVFWRLPKSGAVVFSSRTELKKLTDLDVNERRELVDEIRSWDHEVSTRRGVELWQRTVVGWCEGKKVFRDNKTVVDAEAMPTVGE